MDIFGRRSYAFSSLIVRAANYVAAMAAYHQHLWDLALPSLQAAPEELQPRGLSLHQEASQLIRQERVTVRHILDAASHNLMTGVAMRRQAWLKSAAIPEDSKARILDLPFDGSGLFDPKTDEILKGLYEAKKAARSYAAQPFYKQRYPWKRQPFYPATQPGKPYPSKQRYYSPSAGYTTRHDQRHKIRSSFKKVDRKNKQSL